MRKRIESSPGQSESPRVAPPALAVVRRRGAPPTASAPLADVFGSVNLCKREAAAGLAQGWRTVCDCAAI